MGWGLSQSRSGGISIRVDAGVPSRGRTERGGAIKGNMPARGGFRRGYIRVGGVVNRTGGRSSKEVDVDVVDCLIESLRRSNLRPIRWEEPARSLVVAMAEEKFV